MQILDQIRAVVNETGERASRAQRIADLIRQGGEYRWVGLYDVRREEVAIVAWSGPGPPAHPRFPADQGLTASAVRSRASVVANDVTKDPRYLTAFGSTRSELIVPVVDPSTGSVLGTLDVESDRDNAFQDQDRAWLEQCALAVVPLFVQSRDRL